MRSNKQLKGIMLLVMSLVLIVILAACSSNNENTANNVGDAEPNQSSDNNANAEEKVYPENGLPVDEEVTLKMGFFESGTGREFVDYAMDTFTEEFPNVNFDVTYSPTIQDVVATKVAAGDDDDMFHMWDSNMAGGYLPMVENGLLEDQEDLWDRKLYDAEGTVRELVMDGTYESYERILGSSYRLPAMSSSAGLFFDKNLFEEKGWNMNPQTWSEFMELLETIKQDGMIPVTYTGVHVDYMYGTGFGPWKEFEYADEQGNLEEFTERFRNWEPPYYSSEEHMNMWSKLYEMGQKGYFTQGVAALDHTQSQMQIIQGQAALVVTGSWVENEMRESTPDGFEWGYMVVPMTDNPDATKWTRLVATRGFYIWAGKPEIEKQWAKEFNLWMLNMDVQAVIGETAGALPLRKDFMEDPEMLDQLQPLTRNIIEYNEKNNVRGESGFRDVSLSHPSFAQSRKVFSEAITEITEGRQDPLPIMEEADRLLQEAYDAYLAEQE